MVFEVHHMGERILTKNEGTMISIFLLSMVAVFPLCLLFYVTAVEWIGFMFAGISLLTLVGTTMLYRKTQETGGRKH